jgi:hypothetical protein
MIIMQEIAQAMQDVLTDETKQAGCDLFPYASLMHMGAH